MRERGVPLNGNTRRAGEPTGPQVFSVEAFVDPAPTGGAVGRTRIPRPRVRDYRARRLLVAADLLALVAALGSWSLLGITHLWAHILWASLTLPLWIGLFRAYGLYAAGSRRVGYATVDDIPAMAHAFLLGTVATWLYLQVTPAGKLVFSELAAFACVAFALALVFRVLARKLSLRLFGAERVLFVGSGQMTPILVRQMLRQPRYGLSPLAVLTRPENDRWPLPLTDAGALADVDAATYITEHRIDRVIISAEGIDDEALLELVNVCRQLCVNVSALPSLASMMGPAATVDHLEGITLIGINTPSLARSNRIFKRTMDIVGASLLLLVTTPVLIAVAVAIKLDSPGPVLFRQNRIGRGGKAFRLTKFRTMVADAESRRAQLLAQSRQAQWLDLEHDPRITRLGRVLRLASLDELPQL